MQTLTLEETHLVSGQGLTRGIGVVGGVVGALYGIQIGLVLGTMATATAGTNGIAAPGAYLLLCSGCFFAPIIGLTVGGALLGCTAGSLTESIISAFD